MDTRNANDYELMAVSGVEAVLIPCTFTGQKKSSKAAFLHYFDRLTSFERKRGKAFGIDVYVAISIHPGDMHDPDSAHQALDSFSSYIDNPAVRAIGEITIQRESADEKALFERQLTLARDAGLPAIVEAPRGDNPKQLDRLAVSLADAIEKYHLDPSRIVMVDLNAQKLEQVWDLKLGAYGIPVSPALNGLFVIHDKVTPAAAAQLLQRYGSDRIIFNSALHFGYGDPLCLARTLLHLRQMDVPEAQLEEVFYQNPQKMFLGD
jgi:predicted metal-dependent TIM-barrel fold hydrolase